MCGRYTLLTDLSEVIESFDIQSVDYRYKVSNNVSPTEQVPAVIREDNRNKLVGFRWGLIPYWTKDPSMGNKLINARAETVATKSSFKHAFKKHRCLIIANGFYEWVHVEKKKIPFHLSLKSGAPIGIAGLYDHWRRPDVELIKTCTIITTNLLCGAPHNRFKGRKVAKNVTGRGYNLPSTNTLSLRRRFLCENMVCIPLVLEFPGLVPA